ncbi:MAG: SMP-30/gluconolactonase/LRE family protein, partial [Verrucomicrobia bacterium]|nr:SMP-30/gluconolactonase/LRE family protein [Verrucomicrobiota bacterium]
MRIEIAWDAADGVGESPVWDSKTESLYWVDIIGRQIRVLHLRSHSVEDSPTPDFPTALALHDNPPGALVALANGIAHWDGEHSFQHLFAPDPFAGNRLNEGKCDPSGRFWVGSMQNNLHANGTSKKITCCRGALFRYDGNASCERLTAHEFGIANTMAWSPDQDYFYCADTIRNIFVRYDYHSTEGIISNPTIWSLDRIPGAPDGSCIDDDGCLWNA